MSQEESNRRIKYALHSHGWSYEEGEKSFLQKHSLKVIPSEYIHDMEGNIFCPACFTNLIRVPKNKEHSSNGRAAYFAHIKKYKNVKCDLRSSKPEGKRFDTYEEAQKAIDDENLVIVSGFLEDKPEALGNGEAEYNETPVEDKKGPISNVPIGRHNGESFKLPSKITTVAGICRNFDENLYKYYYFPGHQHAIRLLDLLKSIDRVEVEDEKPQLYYGTIVKSYNAGQNPKPSNIRMTELLCHENVHDFFLKATDQISQEKGISDDSKGRIVLMYGKVTGSGIGLCIERLKWGEFALLPEKYNSLLS
ncbi:MAG TPA: hypothetical protein DF427_09230 [Moraxellaceae bacterium]|nr:hypothetical protein [Moraxellaceae bacterium]